MVLKINLQPRAILYYYWFSLQILLIWCVLLAYYWQGGLGKRRFIVSFEQVKYLLRHCCLQSIVC